MYYRGILNGIKCLSYLKILANRDRFWNSWLIFYHEKPKFRSIKILKNHCFPPNTEETFIFFKIFINTCTYQQDVIHILNAFWYVKCLKLIEGLLGGPIIYRPMKQEGTCKSRGTKQGDNGIWTFLNYIFWVVKAISKGQKFKMLQSHQISYLSYQEH